ncbi:unnamed protein product [Durusdinium trenchii]|uniref:Uncharacterized protein n=1 Tax=Durusdinium trenchii TaxID=1381693 RepID=A0ABP0STJ2_9DINO
MFRSVLHLARPKRQVPRPESSGLPDLAQWALTVGLGTLLPGFALFKLFTATGAVEAERGAQEELARHQRLGRTAQQV